jgi:hypothetical protein
LRTVAGGTAGTRGRVQQLKGKSAWPRLFIGVVVSAAIGLASAPHLAGGTVHTGLGRLEYWDFSDSAVAPSEWDISLMVVMQSAKDASSVGIYWIIAPYGVTLTPPDSTYDVLTLAPEYPTGYYGAYEMVPYRTWVCRTAEGHYAKFRFLGESYVEFEYTYQDNGSRYFRDGVPVEGSTWGRIKTLYE